MIKLKQ